MDDGVILTMVFFMTCPAHAASGLTLAQRQYGVAVFDASPSTPCWRGVGMIAARRVLYGARPPVV
jgi:hypothetical protein